MIPDLADFTVSYRYTFPSSTDAAAKYSLILGDSPNTGTAQLYWAEKSYPALMVDSTFEAATAKADILKLMAVGGPMIFMNGLSHHQLTSMMHDMAGRPKGMHKLAISEWSQVPLKDRIRTELDSIKSICGTGSPMFDILSTPEAENHINSEGFCYWDPTNGFTDSENPMLPLFLYDTFVGLQNTGAFYHSNPTCQRTSFTNDYGIQYGVVNCTPGFHKALIFRKSCGKRNSAMVAVSVLVLLPEDIVPVIVTGPDIVIKEPRTSTSNSTDLSHLSALTQGDNVYIPAGAAPRVEDLMYRFIWARRTDGGLVHVSNREVCRQAKLISAVTVSRHVRISTYNAKDLQISMEIKGGKDIVRSIPGHGYEDGCIPGDWVESLLSKYGPRRRNSRANRKDRSAGATATTETSGEPATVETALNQ